MLASARLFLLQGPAAIVGTAISVVLGVIGVVQLIRGDSFWMWIALGSLALVAVSFVSFHRERDTFEAKVADLFAEGIPLVEALTPEIPEDATEIAIGAGAAEIDQAASFLGRVQELIRRERPWLLPVFQEAWEAEKVKDKQRQEKRTEAQNEPGYPEGMKLRAFAEESQGAPQRIVERTLTALSAVRGRKDGVGR